MNLKRRIAVAGAAAMAAVSLGACAYATPDTASIGLSYTGGSFESKAFDKCVSPGRRETSDWGGDVYYYPVGNRTWDFSTRPGADSPPFLVSTKNNQELIVSGTIVFRLVTDCSEYKDAQGKVWPGGKIQKFHDTIGRSKGAFFGEDSTQVPAGWVASLGLYLGGPSERAMDATGGNYTWQDLYSKPEVVAAFVDAVVRDIPSRVKDATGGEVYFEIVSVQLDKPTVPDALKKELEATEASILAQSRANQDKAFAESFPGGLSGYAAYKQQQAQADLAAAQARCLDAGKCTSVPFGGQVR